MRSNYNIPFTPAPSAALAPRCAARPLRPAFTLVELLIVITIMAILASMMLFALAGAQQTAIEMRTRGTIAKLNAIIMDKYESYRTRRLPISVPAGTAPMAAAKYRLDALRELMRMEMPDRFSDLQDVPITHTTAGDSSSPLITVPSATQSYRLALPSGAIKTNQGAKCLYLIVTHGLGDPDIMEQFAPYEIGVPDTDGMKVFLDGWGKPIHFLRWAPAFYSPLQPDPTVTTGIKPVHDQFDPLLVYPASTNVALYPLIYSAGPDGGDEIGSGGALLHYGANNNDPYCSLTTASPVGNWSDDNNDGTDNRLDNITNHDIETR